MIRIVIVAFALSVVPGGMAAQSLFSGAGLGIPTDAGDARSRALGGVGIGLAGTALLPGDPAAAAGMVVPTAIFTAQPSWVEFSRPNESADFQATRFPLAGIAYPAWSLGTVTFTVSSFLDQRYEASRPITIDLLNGQADGTDRFISEGGVSELRLGLARPLGSGVAAALTVGRYNGTSTRRLVRTLSGIATQEVAVDYEDGGRWAFSGTSVTGGVSVNIGEMARLAGSLTWSSDLDAEASEDTQGADRSYALPFQFRIGGTAVLAPGLAVSASYHGADWSPTADDLRGTTGAAATANLGVGVELARARLLGRSAPLRFGYRRAELPFDLDGGEPVETAWTAGLGLGLSENASVILAGVDLAVERGERVEGSISEAFWRASLTLRVAGF